SCSTRSTSPASTPRARRRPSRKWVTPEASRALWLKAEAAPEIFALHHLADEGRMQRAFGVGRARRQLPRPYPVVHPRGDRGGLDQGSGSERQAPLAAALDRKS